MSVIVKNMDMPKNCCECELCYGAECNTWRFCSYDSFEDTRASDCPLVEVPTPHRRLIEEPKAFDLDGLFYIEPHDFERIGEYFVAQVKEQPTIIEAEDET